ncbi:MAG: DUF72 domain-containing protein [Planctomycetota bacterium]
MIRVGPAGWSYPDWEGIVVPRRKPPGFHPLRHLARYVECVEVNSSFYRAPEPAHAKQWVELVADRARFRFLAKLHRVFTHAPLPEREADVRTAVEAFRAGVAPLHAAGQLAALLVQFPLSFRMAPAALARLRAIAAHFGDFPLVLEVRHRSWFDPAPRAEVAAMGYSVAQIDLPAGPDHPPAGVQASGPIGYLRLHGRNRAAWFDARAGRDQRYDYLYSPPEIAELAQLARRLAGQADETYVITNNHFAGKAVANALELLAALGEDEPLAPGELIDAFPRLRGRVRADGQQSLFW